MQKLYGTVVPIVTPLTEEDTIDVESLKNLVNHVIDGGLQCLYPCGTTGEMMYLTVEERKQVAEVTVKEAAGRVPVFVHAWVGIVDLDGCIICQIMQVAATL